MPGNFPPEWVVTLNRNMHLPMLMMQMINKPVTTLHWQGMPIPLFENGLQNAVLIALYLMFLNALTIWAYSFIPISERWRTACLQIGLTTSVNTLATTARAGCGAWNSNP